VSTDPKNIDGDDGTSAGHVRHSFDRAHQQTQKQEALEAVEAGEAGEAEKQ
jgi:hypothetical protein